MQQFRFAPYPTDIRPVRPPAVAPENLCDGECYVEFAWPDGYSEVATCLGCLGCAGDDQPPF